MLIRPSIQKDLERIENIDGGNFIYCLWEGYLNKPETKRFIDYLVKRSFCIHKVHTSWHADMPTLKELVKAVNPKCIVPIHTFCSGEYKNIFSAPVMECDDGEVVGGS